MKVKETKGITLIAVIITIIVLAILAGVTIASLRGKDGIINNAEKAVGKYNGKVEEETAFLASVQQWLDGNGTGGSGSSGGTSGGSSNISYGVSGLTKLTGNAKVDGNGLATENTLIQPNDNSNVLIVIPTGFAPAILETSNSTTSASGESGKVKSIMPSDQWKNITEEQINQGIVIVNNAITYTGEVPNFEEYVWISIPNSNEFASMVVANKDDVGKHYWDDPNKMEYQNMVASIIKNRGFYIGRYEASANGTIAQSKRGENVWVNISQTSAITACKNSTTINNLHLIYGIEWDSVMSWLAEKATINGYKATTDDIYSSSASWGNYKNSTGNAATNSGGSSQQKSGTSEYWKANNIYDLAGNAWEWTQERMNTGYYRVVRGGSYKYDGHIYPAAYRNSDRFGYGNTCDFIGDGFGFRSSFYL